MVRVGLEFALCSFGAGDVGVHGAGVAGSDVMTGGGWPWEPGLGLELSGESSWPSDWMIERRDLAGEGQMAVVRRLMGSICVLRWIVLSTRDGGERLGGEKIMVSIESLDVTEVDIMELVGELKLL